MDQFETPRLRASRLRSSDLPHYLRLFGDPRVVKTLLGDTPAPDEAEIAQWLRLSVEHFDRYGFGYWLFRNRADSRFVGRAGLKRSEVDGRREVEIGFALLPDFWGKGLGTEIVECVTRIALDHYGVSSVVGYALSSNTGSRRLMEKVGFMLEKELVLDGQLHVVYRLSSN